MDNSTVRECSYGLLSIAQVDAATFTGCTFRDCTGYDMVGLGGASHALFRGCEFTNNRWDDSWSHFLSMDDEASAAFEGCSFDQAAFADLTGDAMAGKHITVDSPLVAS